MGLFNKKYICNRCGHVFDESESKWVDIDSEGKDTIDSGSVMDSLPICPKCDSDNISEYHTGKKTSNNDFSSYKDLLFWIILFILLYILANF